MRMLQDWNTRAAERAPDARAVVGAHDTLTYGELERASNRIARVLHEEGCRRGDRVVVHLSKSPQAIATLLGVLKAGGVYVPMTPADRIVRKAHILRESDPRFAIFRDEDQDLVANMETRGALRGTRIGRLGSGAALDPAHFALDRDDVDEHGVDVPGGRDGDLAYLMFSCGPKGFPTAVPTTHKSARTRIEWAVRYFELGPQDRLAGHAELTFAPFILDVYAALAAGAELHCGPPSTRPTPEELLDFLEGQGITVWSSLPSRLSAIARSDAFAQRDLPSLRHVAWTGDVLPTPVLMRWKARLPAVAFTNLYGTAETPVTGSHYRVPDDFSDPGADIPIGTAAREGGLVLLDDRMRPIGPGEVGNIYLCGDGLACGYWRDAERTRAAFFSPDGLGRLFRTGDLGRIDADGTVHLLGRAETQIDPGATQLATTRIENLLLQLGEIQACAVLRLPGKDASQGSVACAYVPSRRGSPLRASRIERRLADHLPSRAIPSRWLLLEELPLDDRGRIDRARARALLGG